MLIFRPGYWGSSRQIGLISLPIPVSLAVPLTAYIDPDDSKVTLTPSSHASLPDSTVNGHTLPSPLKLDLDTSTEVSRASAHPVSISTIAVIAIDIFRLTLSSIAAPAGPAVVGIPTAPGLAPDPTADGRPASGVQADSSVALMVKRSARPLGCCSASRCQPTPVVVGRRLTAWRRPRIMLDGLKTAWRCSLTFTAQASRLADQPMRGRPSDGLLPASVSRHCRHRSCR